jgi:hypothetical protein
VENPGSGDVTVRFVNQATAESTEVKTKGANIKKLLPRASYEVYVKQGTTNYVALTKTKGFLKTTTVSGKLISEAGVRYIGQNPGSCLYFINILYSYECGQDVSTLKAHMPATSTQPTYTNNGPGDYSTIEGIVTTGGSPYVLTKEQESSQHMLRPLNPNLSFGAPVYLDQQSDPTDYTTTPYQQGFLVYSADFKTIKYYKDLVEQPSVIKTIEPSKATSRPAGLSVDGSTMGLLYNSISENDEDAGAQDETLTGNKPLVGKSQFIVYSDSQHKTFSFDQLLTQAVFCGKQQVCTLSGTVMTIYNISGSKPQVVFTVQDVKDVQYIAGKIVVATSKNIVELDPTTYQGHVTYSLGGYTYCGLSATAASYTVCVVAPAGGASALYIERERKTDSIDKKILSLSQQADVDDISPYGNYLYITQSAGGLSYQPSIAGYGYSPSVIKEATTAINKEISRLGINTEQYQVLYTLK